MTRFALIAVLLMTACKIRNEQSCEIPGNCAEGDGGVTACTTNDDCTAATPICNVAAEVCVQCIDNGQCSGTSPVCNTTHSCEGCQTDNQCLSEACLDDGACASPEAVIFASPNGLDAVGCGLTSDNPCTLTRAISESTAERNLIKLTAETFTSTGGEGFVIDGGAVDHPVTFLARGATIFHSGSGANFTIKNGANMTFVGGTVANGEGNSGHGFTCTGTSALTVIGALVQDNEGFGIRSEDCTLEVTKSTIHNNDNGGITVSLGTFVIIGNFIHGNGDFAKTVGGILISVPENPTNRLEFNSINLNFAAFGVGNGIECQAGPSFVARNNIVFNNNHAANSVEVDGCKYSFNDIGPLAVVAGSSDGTNINVDPMFANQTNGNLHLLPGTPLLDSADPAAMITGVAAVDIDDEQRTLPTEMGADAVP